MQVVADRPAYNCDSYLNASLHIPYSVQLNPNMDKPITTAAVAAGGFLTHEDSQLVSTPVVEVFPAEFVAPPSSSTAMPPPKSTVLMGRLLLPYRSGLRPIAVFHRQGTPLPQAPSRWLWPPPRPHAHHPGGVDCPGANHQIDCWSPSLPLLTPHPDMPSTPTHYPPSPSSFIKTHSGIPKTSHPFYETSGPSKTHPSLFIDIHENDVADQLANQVKLLPDNSIQQTEASISQLLTTARLFNEAIPNPPPNRNDIEQWQYDTTVDRPHEDRLVDSNSALRHTLDPRRHSYADTANRPSTPSITWSPFQPTPTSDANYIKYCLATSTPKPDRDQAINIIRHLQRHPDILHPLALKDIFQ